MHHARSRIDLYVQINLARAVSVVPSVYLLAIGLERTTDLYFGLIWPAFEFVVSTHNAAFLDSGEHAS
mgnify:FL=1